MSFLKTTHHKFVLVRLMKKQKKKYDSFHNESLCKDIMKIPKGLLVVKNVTSS